VWYWYVDEKINSFGKIVGMDFNQKAVDLTRKRGCVVKKGSVTKIPFESKSFDVVTCIDVLVCKEIDDDTRALREICRVLKPKGITIVRVSANKWLDLAHDKHVHSIRRYEKSELIEMFKQSNFEILRISHMNVFLLPIVSLKSAIEKVFPPKNIESSIGDVNPLINWCARLISEIENFLLLRADIPLGLGLLVVARKVNDK